MIPEEIVMDETKCTQDCSTCCNTCEEDAPKVKDFFTQMEDLTSALHGEEGFGVLEKVVSELDKEE